MAATYIRLADNSCERVLIEPGVELYKQALQLRTALKLAPQLIAETNICIGNAYTYKQEYATAKSFFLIAKEALAGASDDGGAMLADLDKKIAMCSCGNLNIVDDDAADAPAASEAAEAAAAAPTIRKREDTAAKIASATIVQVGACMCGLLAVVA